MGRLLFLPFSIVAGLIAGMLGKRLFEQIWTAIDPDDPPDAKHRDIPVTKMILALAIEGAIFKAVRGALDHYSRRAFARTTGSWPGEEEPKPE